MEELYAQAYILISKVGFNYSDVKGMTKIERASFLKLYNDEQEIIQKHSESM